MSTARRILHRLALPLFIAAGCATYADERVTEEQRDDAMQILADYTDNRSKVSKFAVAMSLEETNTYRGRAEKNTAHSDWHLSTFDRTKSKRRFDTIARRTIPTSDGSLVTTDGKQILYANAGKYLYKFGSQFESVFDANELTDEEFAEKRIFNFMRCIDPINLPVSSGQELFLRERFPREIIPESRFHEGSVVKFNKELRWTDVHFLQSEKLKVYMAMRFAKHDKRKLPIKLVLYRIGPDGNEQEMSVVDTVWGKLPNDDAWVPVSVSRSAVAGNPSKPTRFTDTEVKLHWVVGEHFPESVFDPKSEIPTVELRDRILDNATKITPRLIDLK